MDINAYRSLGAAGEETVGSDLELCAEEVVETEVSYHGYQGIAETGRDEHEDIAPAAVVFEARQDIGCEVGFEVVLVEVGAEGLEHIEPSALEEQKEQDGHLLIGIAVALVELVGDEELEEIEEGDALLIEKDLAPLLHVLNEEHGRLPVQERLVEIEECRRASSHII